MLGPSGFSQDTIRRGSLPIGDPTLLKQYSAEKLGVPLSFVDEEAGDRVGPDVEADLRRALQSVVRALEDQETIGRIGSRRLRSVCLGLVSDVVRRLFHVGVTSPCRRDMYDFLRVVTVDDDDDRHVVYTDAVDAVVAVMDFNSLVSRAMTACVDLASDLSECTACLRFLLPLGVLPPPVASRVFAACRMLLDRVLDGELEAHGVTQPELDRFIAVTHAFMDGRSLPK